MADLGLVQAFARYGAKLKNRQWSVCALAPNGDLVVSQWNHDYTMIDSDTGETRDHLSRWSGHGNRELRDAIEEAFNSGRTIRLVMAYAADPEYVKSAKNASKVTKSYDVVCYSETDFLKLEEKIMITRRLSLSVVLLFSFTATPACAESYGDILTFANQFKGRFPSEITNTAPFEKEYRGEFRPFIHDATGDVRYDDEKQEVVLTLAMITSARSSTKGLIAERCVKQGGGTGVTAMGVKFSYSRETCQVVTVDDHSMNLLRRQSSERQQSEMRSCSENAGDLKGDERRQFISNCLTSDNVRIPATPAVYREILRNGLIVERILRPELQKDTPPVKYQQELVRPRLDWKTETDFHRYTVTGRFVETRFYLAGTRKLLGIQK